MLREAKVDGPYTNLRAELEAVRLMLWESVDAADPDRRAALLKLLVEVVEKLHGLPVEKGSKVDELLARRETRAQKRPAG
jgi:hypothetical protein